MGESIIENIDKELLIRISKGDERAFARLFSAFYDQLYSVTITYLKVHEHAQDLVQQVFLKVWEKKEKLADVDRIDDYLFIIARNEVMNFFRKESRSERYVQYIKELLRDEAGTPEEQLSLKQKRESIEKAVAQLPEQQKEAWRLRELGLPQQEIAVRMQISIHTVKGHIAKALQAIRAWVLTHTDILLLFFLIIF